MTEELKAYVNAYMDGLEVEYRFNMKWYVVESFSDFDDTSADYRIKPKAEDKWQRVIDEGYLCKFWDYVEEQYHVNILTKVFDSHVTQYPYTLNGGVGYVNCEVLREKGIKQPYFQGDDINLTKPMVVYFDDGHIDFVYTHPCASLDLSKLVAYIEV